MRLRSSESPAPWSWRVFPPEIRNRILREITRRKNPGWGSHAAVSKEWQAFLQPLLFSKLKLDADCLCDFARIVPPKSKLRHLVRHICLNITTTEGYIKGSLVYSAIRNLLDILKKWKREGDLTLELHVYSPRDSELGFRSLFLHSDEVDAPLAAGHIADAWKRESPYNDSAQMVDIPDSSIMRLFQYLHFASRDAPTREYPQTKAVTRFLVRRQMRRYITPQDMSYIVGCLSGLEVVWYEPWAPSPATRVRHDDAFSRWLIAPLRRTVKNIIIFEDSYRFYKNTAEGNSQTAASDPNLSDRPAETLVKASLKMRNLAVAYQVAAEKWFASCEPKMRWKFLESLALTSPTLRSCSSDRIEKVICRAAQVVRNMPCLRLLVLWYGERRSASAFIFERVNETTASITWRGNWSYCFTERIRNSWRCVAETLGAETLDMKHELIEADIDSYGDAIYHLQLPCQVITPESLWQIRREAYLPE